MKPMKSLVMTAGFLIGTTLAWAGTNGAVHSLRGDVPLNAPSVATEAKPVLDGEGKIARNYPQQPPLIPHVIDDLTINQEGNDCLNCHNWNSEVPGATKVGVSHFLNRSDQALATISPRRYFCTQCHVTQSNAKPLVPNTFKSVADDE